MNSVARKRWLAAAFVIGLAAAFIWGDPKAWLNRAIAAVESLGAWGPLVYIAAYVAATVLLVPGSALTLAAGALFGVGKGTAIVSLASTGGAAAAFLTGRFLARDWVAARIAAHPAFARLDAALRREGWKIVVLTRLSPAFPFVLLNYAFGLTRVKFAHYVLASWLGMLPGTVLYVYLGSLARAGAQAGARSPWEWALYGVGLAATIVVTIAVTRMARQAMRRSGLETEKSGDTGHD